MVMLFCDEDGQMIEEKSVDVNVLGRKMNDKGITVGQNVSDNMCSIL